MAPGRRRKCRVGGCSGAPPRQQNEIRGSRILGSGDGSKYAEARDVVPFRGMSLSCTYMDSNILHEKPRFELLRSMWDFCCNGHFSVSTKDEDSLSLRPLTCERCSKEPASQHWFQLSHRTRTPGESDLGPTGASGLGAPVHWRCAQMT